MTSTLPLTGVRVLDLTQLLAGPYCTMLLADMGADVIKVEPPRGELQRQSMRLSPDDPCPPPFVAVNRNKRGIVIDLATDAGRDLFLDLAATSDVVVENFRPGVVAKLGIDHDAVAAVRPSIVYASISGFSEDGPYADRPGLDLVAQAMSGLMSITGHPGQPPAKVGVPVTDIVAGILCAVGILAALRDAQASGRGRRVTTNLLDAGIGLGLWESIEYWTLARVPEPAGSGHRMAAPQQAYPTQDGYIVIGGGADKLWERLCTSLGRDDLRDDPRFATNLGRLEHRAELEDALESVLTTERTEVWVERLSSAGVPAAPIRDYREVLDDPATAASGMIQELPHPKGGTVKTLGTPIRLDDVAPRLEAPPLLGQHTDDVLNECGIDAQHIAALRAAGVLGDAADVPR